MENKMKCNNENSLLVSIVLGMVLALCLWFLFVQAKMLTVFLKLEQFLQILS